MKLLKREPQVSEIARRRYSLRLRSQSASSSVLRLNQKVSKTRRTPSNPYLFMHAFYPCGRNAAEAVHSCRRIRANGALRNPGAQKV
eukprot:1932688-Pleurochrysis_carterae.AAC.1